MARWSANPLREVPLIAVVREARHFENVRRA
jgi:hypothetical protein